MKAFFHKTDLDGHCSGAIVKKKHPACEMIGVDYNDKIADFNIRYAETIFVVDFSFGEADMLWLQDNTGLHWIDHHKTSIDWAFETKFLASSGQSLEIGKAGCELTWDYLFPDEPMPKAVRLLGRYDVWDHEDPDVLPFQWGMRGIKNTLPDSRIWSTFIPWDVFSQNIIEKMIEQTIEYGKIVLEYQVQQDEIYAKGMSFEVDFEGYRAIVINRSFTNSKLFDSVYDEEKHDLMINYGYKPKQYRVSLYTSKPDVDVSAIAKKYGGGGHKGAAGFFCEKVPFL